MRNLGYSVPAIWMPDRRRLIRPPNFGTFQDFFYPALEFLAFNESVGIPQNLAPNGVDLSVVFNNTMDWANELDGIGVSPAATNDGVTITHPQTRWDNGGTVTIAFRKTGPQSSFQRLFEGASEKFFVRPNVGEDGLDAKIDSIIFGPGSNAIAATWENGEFHVITIGWPKNSDSGPYYFIFDGQMLSNETKSNQTNIDIASTFTLNNRTALNRAAGITPYLWLMTDGKQPPEFARAFNERIYNSVMESLFLPRPSDYFFFIPAAAGGDITGTAQFSLAPSATLVGSGALAGASSLSVAGAGSLVGLGALAGATALTIAGSGTLTGFGALAGTSAWSLTLTGSMVGSGALSGAAALALTLSGALVGAGALSGSSAFNFSPSGTLSGRGELIAATTISFAISGAMTGLGGGAITGSTSLAVTPNGTLIGTGALIGTIGVTVTPSGTLINAAGGAPASRTLAVSAQNRTNNVEAQSRTCIVPAQNRTLTS